MSKAREIVAAWLASASRKAPASVLRATPARGEVMDKNELEEKTWLASKVEAALDAEKSLAIEAEPVKADVIGGRAGGQTLESKTEAVS